jgi:DNA-binding MarR family transcriptional regulator
VTNTSAHQAPQAVTTELVDVVNLVAQVIWADMRRSGQAIEPTQWATLRLIAAGSWTMSELARHKAVSLPTMSKSVDMLARRGWVERFVDEADRRQTLVRLTPGGREMLAECRRQAEASIEKKLAGLAEPEREALTASLRAVRAALSSAE